jgi:hypothetical protein
MLSFQNKELLSLFLTSEEISKVSLAVLYDSDNDDREDDAVEDFKYDSLKKK